MQLQSTAFADMGDIPQRFTCDGDNVSPPLQWSDPPKGVRSFALLCKDPDAPSGIWRHWAVYDIPCGQDRLGEALSPQTEGVRQCVNDFGRSGYGGPCPPHGHGPHRYHFALLALDTPSLTFRSGASCADVERAAARHVLAEAQLVGIYQR